MLLVTVVFLIFSPHSQEVAQHHQIDIVVLTLSYILHHALQIFDIFATRVSSLLVCIHFA